MNDDTASVIDVESPSLSPPPVSPPASPPPPSLPLLRPPASLQHPPFTLSSDNDEQPSEPFPCSSDHLKPPTALLHPPFGRLGDGPPAGPLTTFSELSFEPFPSTSSFHSSDPQPPARRRGHHQMPTVIGPYQRPTAGQPATQKVRRTTKQREGQAKKSGHFTSKWQEWHVPLLQQQQQQQQKSQQPQRPLQPQQPQQRNPLQQQLRQQLQLKIQQQQESTTLTTAAATAASVYQSSTSLRDLYAMINAPQQTRPLSYVSLPTNHPTTANNPINNPVMLLPAANNQTIPRAAITPSLSLLSRYVSLSPDLSNISQGMCRLIQVCFMIRGMLNG
jgi:hypothetical protein